MSKVILITGASRGFGRLWAEALLQKGYKVVLTARHIDGVADIVNQYKDSALALALDVNNRQQAFEVVEKTVAHFGQIDVLINNAGYGLVGAIEEASEAEARMQMDTNFFGTLWLSQAVLPFFRMQGSGHIIQVSSVLGLVTLPMLALYNASKFAVEGLSESLAAEVKDFGIHLTIVEPNAYETDWSGTSAVQSKAISAYDAEREKMKSTFKPETVGKPEATVTAICQLIEDKNPPLRLLLGKAGLPLVKHVYTERLALFEEWKDVSAAAHGK